MIRVRLLLSPISLPRCLSHFFLALRLARALNLLISRKIKNGNIAGGARPHTCAHVALGVLLLRSRMRDELFCHLPSPSWPFYLIFPSSFSLVLGRRSLSPLSTPFMRNITSNMIKLTARRVYSLSRALAFSLGLHFSLFVFLLSLALCVCEMFTSARGRWKKKIKFYHEEVVVVSARKS